MEALNNRIYSAESKISSLQDGSVRTQHLLRNVTTNVTAITEESKQYVDSVVDNVNGEIEELKDKTDITNESLREAIFEVAHKIYPQISHLTDESKTTANELEILMEQERLLTFPSVILDSGGSWNGTILSHGDTFLLKTDDTIKFNKLVGLVKPIISTFYMTGNISSASAWGPVDSIDIATPFTFDSNDWTLSPDFTPLNVAMNGTTTFAYFDVTIKIIATIASAASVTTGGLVVALVGTQTVPAIMLKRIITYHFVDGTIKSGTNTQVALLRPTAGFYTGNDMIDDLYLNYEITTAKSSNLGTHGRGRTLFPSVFEWTNPDVSSQTMLSLV